MRRTALRRRVFARRGIRLLSALLAACLLAGCALPGLSLLPQPTPGPEAPAPSATPQPEPLRLFVAEEAAPAGFSALIEAWCAGQGAAVEWVGSAEEAGLALLARRPNDGNYADLSAEPLLGVLAQSASALPGQSEAEGCCALPLGLEGYGYLADGELLAALLGEGFTPELLQQASWAEWEAFIETLGGWIEQPSEQTVTLAGQTFSLPAEPPAAAQNLTGVFAVPAAAPDAFAGSALSPLLCAAFAGPDTIQPDPALLTGPLNSLWAALRLETGWMAGPSGPLLRGAGSGDNGGNGSDAAAAQTLADAAALLQEGRAVFCRAGSGALAALCEPEFAARLVLIPLKYSLDETDLSPAAAFTLEQLAGWPVAATPGWLAIPAGASEAQRLGAESFLLWLSFSAEGQQALTRCTGLLGIAGAAGESPAQVSLAAAIASGEILPDLAAAFSPAAQAAVSAVLTEDWLPQAQWSPAQRPAYVEAVLAALSQS